MQNEIKIYVATHKRIDIELPNIYSLSQVGCELNDDLGYLKDNTGDNISYKNKNYCELTLLYWIWKNSSYNIVGLVHYRRFFYNNLFLPKILNYELIKKEISDNKIIVPFSRFIKCKNVYEDYKKYHHIDDYDEAIKIILEKYPDYKKAINSVNNSKKLYCYNMFISSKKILNQYCSWLFDILFELEKRINIDSYDDYNKRVFGFISERLFNIWIAYNNISVKEYPVYQLKEDKIDKYLKQTIKQIIGKI